MRVSVRMQGHAVKGELNRLERNVQSPAVSTQEEGLRACICVCVTEDEGECRMLMWS